MKASQLGCRARRLECCATASRMRVGALRTRFHAHRDPHPPKTSMEPLKNSTFLLCLGFAASWAFPPSTERGVLLIARNSGTSFPDLFASFLAARHNSEVLEQLVGLGDCVGSRGVLESVYTLRGSCCDSAIPVMLLKVLLLARPV